jgi:hypothetical protein
MGSNSFALKVRIWLDQVSTTCDSGWVRSPQAGSVLVMQSICGVDLTSVVVQS